MDTDTIEEKQQFLREKILNNKYDINAFTEFLSVKKPQANLDLNEWTLQELQVIVEEFCSQNQPQENVNENINLNAEEVPNLNNNVNDEIINEPENFEYKEEQNNNQNKENDPNNKDTNQGTNIELYEKCFSMDHSKLSKASNIQITVSEPQIVKGNPFYSGYVTYLVRTSPLEFRVRRKYSDFLWLYNFLQKYFVFSILPPAPKKKSIDISDEKAILKSIRSLQNFLNRIFMDPLVSKHTVLHYFLSIEEGKEWSKKKKEFDHVLSKTHEHVITSDGKVEYTFTPGKETKLQNIDIYMNNNELLLKNLILSYKEMFSAFETAFSKIKNTAQIWEQLCTNSIAFDENPFIIKSYKLMNEFTNNWKNSLQNQLQVCKLKLVEFFRYKKNEYISMKNLVKKCISVKNSFYKKKQKLLNEKEELFKSQNIFKWEINENEIKNKLKLFQNKEHSISIMLPTKTKEVKLKEKSYGIYLNMVLREFDRLTKLNKILIPQQIVSFGESDSHIINDIHLAHSDILSYKEEIKDFNLYEIKIKDS